MPQIYDMGPTAKAVPSEGRRAEYFFALKIQRLRPGLNPRTWVLKASTLPLDHRSRTVILDSLNKLTYALLILSTQSYLCNR